MSWSGYCRIANFNLHGEFTEVKSKLLMYSDSMKNFRRCNIRMDPNQPLLNPKTEEEWFSLFSRRPTYAYQGGFLLVENTRVTVSKRQK